jgi:hypothetical protein
MSCVTGYRHVTILVYRRPWRRLFRRQMILICVACDLRVEDPT